MAQDYAMEERQTATQTTTKLCFKEAHLIHKSMWGSSNLSAAHSKQRLVESETEYQFTYTTDQLLFYQERTIEITIKNIHRA